MTKKETLQAITTLKLYYPNALKDLPSEELEIMVVLWHKKLEQYDKELVMKAIDRITSKSKWMPSVAELLDEIIAIQVPELKESGLDQWQVVLQAMRKYGSYKKKEAFEMMNTRTKQIIDKMNWDRLCEMTTNELDWKQKDFVSMYNDDTEIITDDLKVGIGFQELLKLSEKQNR